MKIMRRFLGISVMLAGILGLALSLAGLVGVWLVKPALASSIEVTITALNSSIDTSQKTMQITGDALEATVEGVDALSVMLNATASSVENTQPIIDQLNTFMSVKLPATMDSATGSLRAAQQGADVLESAIRSFENFRGVISGVPLVSAFIEPPAQSYDPEVPLGDSLGNLATDLESLPDMFTEMASNLESADDNLKTIQDSLITMSESVSAISESLSEYEAMIAETQSSLENLKSLLTGIQDNLSTILNGAAIVLSLGFLWLLAAQVVIFSQGWELFQGTADRMEDGEPTAMAEDDHIEEPRADEPPADLPAEDEASEDEPAAGT